MATRYRLNLMEISGSLGDLGTLLPMALGMILICGLDPTGVFASIGLFYMLAGLYFGLTVPVQPMKVIGAYAIATAMPASQVMAAGLWMALFLLIIGGTNMISWIGRMIPKAVIRGVQLSTGLLLMAQGVRFMMGTSTYQTLHKLTEPYLTLQSIGPLPVGVVLGVIAGLLTFLLLDSRKFPAGLVVVVAGLIFGLIFRRPENLIGVTLGWHLPVLGPIALPEIDSFIIVLVTVALPQLPMTIGNAVVANADLSREYFGSASDKVTYRALTLSMALANLGSTLIGGMPLCHGAGGLAAHYRFGARTAGSNLFIGGLFLILALLLGSRVVIVAYLMPMAILGVLLLFAGSQLALTIIDLDRRADLLVALLMAGITLASNLAAAFLVGIVVSLTIEKINLKI